MTAVTTPELTDTPRRILDATFAAIQDYGLTRITVEDVAQRAGLSRQTVYRYFPSKDDLIVALVSREEEKFLDGVRAAFLEHHDLETAATESVRFVLAYARTHPLMERLLGPDQQTFLPYVTTRAEPAFVRARETMVGLLLARQPDADVERLRTLVDGTTRALVSYMLTPTDRDTDDIASTMARLIASVIDSKEEVSA
jgi:AcrR family transcriptional regulator